MSAPHVAAPLADLPSQAHGRKATWFELFFDLVFVIAVAQLSGAYAHHFDWAGAAGSALLLLALWWCWLGHTFHATRFDEQRLDQRLLGLVQIIAVIVIGYGVSDAFGARGAAFAIGLAVFKLLLALAYLREWRWRGAHGLIRAYAGLYLLQAGLWAYGHVPIYVGVFSLAAGTVAMAGDDAWTAPQRLLHLGGIALIPLGLALLRAASRKAG